MIIDENLNKYTIDDVRDIIKVLKENNNNLLINEIKDNLLFFRDIYNISEIVENFLLVNFDYFLSIKYLTEID